MLSRILAVVTLALLASPGQANANDTNPVKPLELWNRAVTFYHRVEVRVLANLLPKGARVELVEYVLGTRRIVIQPCSLAYSHAIANQSPETLSRVDLYWRDSSRLVVWYQCDKRFVWRVTKVVVND